MENTYLPNASETIPNTLTLYRQLFNHLDLSAFNPSELLDLAALSAEQAEGLCHGLMLFGHLLQETPAAGCRRLGTAEPLSQRYGTSGSCVM
ncbi:hypothetical protein AAIG30_13645 [Serratia nevei]|uniref:hypothetical protein n=1 Tax=Serratia nevei TaxID=2703794 RepID=UPI00313AB94A